MCGVVWVFVVWMGGVLCVGCVFVCHFHGDASFSICIPLSALSPSLFLAMSFRDNLHSCS